MEDSAKTKAAKVRTKAQNELVVGRGKGKAVVSSKSAKQKRKEVFYDRRILHVLIIYIEACSGRPDNRGRG